ncbi:MAG: acyltransferase domain-containing protein, partial [Desulfobacteraceae bacterium]|nr:acyltransferase domain-containing protein [Desulfobacteraceae bacterium]
MILDAAMTFEKPNQTAIAIIAAAGFFPKAPGLRDYWHLLFQGVDAISEIPASHWSPGDYYDPDPQKADHVYCKRGGFLEPVAFDPAEFGIPPAALQATDTSQLLGLLAAKRLLEAAGYGEGREFDRDRTSVILGVTGTQELVIPLGARLGYPAWRKALESAGLPPETVRAALERMAEAYIPWQENSFPGLLGNVVAGRICNRLNLGGTNCVVDAACASSMSAVHLAVMELQARRCDMAISGGIDTLNDIFMHMCFARTQTLSKTGDARPFAAAADGTVLGEGVGLLLLKRLADAEAHGDTILAVIRGVGSASDGKSQSIYAPRPEGQAKALRKAYRDAGFKPSTVGLLEAHGTGTRVGDRVEFTALCDVFGESGPRPTPCALGSVKSNIGHTKAAAGAAGLIKAALALHHKVLPKTLKADTPDPDLGIAESPFYLNTETRPWIAADGHPRRAGVSAFGFGGSNFHLVLEEHSPRKTAVAWDGSVEIVAFSAADAEGLRSRLQEAAAALEPSPPLAEIARLADDSRRSFSTRDAHRLVLTIQRPPAATSAQAAAAFAGSLQHAAELLAQNGCDHSWGQAGVFYGCGAPAAKAAFLFPGQGSQYVGMGRDLACIFPEALAAFEAADRALEGSPKLSEIVFPSPARNDREKAAQEKILRQTDKAQPAIGALSLAMLAVLERFGVHPQAACGHSFGELTALHAAGRLSVGDFLALSVARGKAMAATARPEGDTSQTSSGAMLAVKAPLAEIADLLAELDLPLVLANRNSPEQGVISGAVDAIAAAERACQKRGLQTRRLPVAAAFHSPLVQSAQVPFAQALAQVEMAESTVPVYANTTGRPYPADSAAARALLGGQLVKPVDFVGAIEALHRDGFQTFVEVGPKSVLTGLVKATLSQKPFQAVALDPSAGTAFGLGDLAKTLSQLAAWGVAVDLTAWEEAPPASRKAVMTIPISGANLKPAPKAAIPPPPVTATPRTGVATEPHSPAPRAIEAGMAPATRPAASPAPAQAHCGAAPGALSSPPNPNNDRAMDTHTNHGRRGFAAEAFEVVREGLKSMEALQHQTAEAHQKFLDTQTAASHCLQRMLDSIQRMTDAALGNPGHHDSTLDSGKVRPAAPMPPPAAAAPTPAGAPPGEAPRPISIAPTVPGAPPAVPQPVAPSAPVEALEAHLLSVVSELTGYPAEMLSLEMDIEADLGIDSIKRVEILSALEER